jgi:hypothetical protein
MNLLVRAVMGAIQDVAREKGLHDARVACKVNARGELVIALLVPERAPGEWRALAQQPVDQREAKRLARATRS